MKHRVAQLENNHHAVTWLKEVIQLKKPIIWSGNGLSYAIAQTIAAICRQYSVPSFAAKCGEIPHIDGALVGFISRSGRNPGVPVDILIVQENSDISWSSRDLSCLAIRDVDNGKDPWFPGAYAIETLQTFACLLGFPLSEYSYVKNIEMQNCLPVFVVERYVELIQTIFTAAAAKLDGLPLIAIEREEIGHGFHFRLWKHPNDYILRCYLSSCDTQAQWRALQRWCKSAGIRFQLNFLAEGLCAQAQIIEAFYLGIHAVEEWALANGVSLNNKPIPEEFDHLRSVGIYSKVLK